MHCIHSFVTNNIHCTIATMHAQLNYSCANRMQLFKICYAFATELVVANAAFSSVKPRDVPNKTQINTRLTAHNMNLLCYINKSIQVLSRSVWKLIDSLHCNETPICSFIWHSVTSWNQHDCFILLRVNQYQFEWNYRKTVASLLFTCIKRKSRSTSTYVKFYVWVETSEHYRD